MRRNYPILANIRFILEKVRPEIRQYFLESDTDGTPFNRSKRAIVYQRAKGQLDKRPFGTQQDIYGTNFEWINHSIAPQHVADHDFRVVIGAPQCRQPYAMSLYNISAMSFGALSANAIRALNKGARLGGFAHDTGEGGFSRHHREFGGDIVWEIGSGYFGCRNEDGSFSPERFAAQATDPQIKMIEIKLSQGAKPGHGGVLPGPKVTSEIAAARGVPVGVDCVSPASHSAFRTPLEMVHFIAQAPRTFKRQAGWLQAVHRPSVGVHGHLQGDARNRHSRRLHRHRRLRGRHRRRAAGIRRSHRHATARRFAVSHTIASSAPGYAIPSASAPSGRIITGFDMARVLALGADWCNAARGFMFALGCVQAQTCHTDHCPSGVATQNQQRQRAIVVPDKAERVRRFQDNTLAALADLVGAAGLSHPRELQATHILRRISSSEFKTFAAHLHVSR